MVSKRETVSRRGPKGNLPEDKKKINMLKL